MREQEIMAKYNVKPEELKAFAAKNYPQFAQNTTVLIQLFLAAKNVTPDPNDFQVISGTKRNINELSPGEWAVVEGIIGPRTRTNSYSGCPVCGKKLEGQYCSECGKQEPVINWFDSYIIGDNTGDVPLVMGPRFANARKMYSGKIIRAKGNFNAQGEFVVSAMEEVVGGISVSLGVQATDKAIGAALADDKSKLANVLSNFPSIRLVDLKQWAAVQSPPITSPLEPIIKELGFNIANGLVTKPAPAPLASPTETTTTSVLPPQSSEPAPATSSAQPSASPPSVEQIEVDKLVKITSVFSSATMKDLKFFHTKEHMVTPLEQLLQKIPHETKGEGEEAIVEFKARMEEA